MTLDNYVPPDKWFQWPDGTRTCWWCSASVRNEVADLHDKHHRRFEGTDPVQHRPDESGLP